MPFSTYTELKTAVSDWLARTDLTTQPADFIALGEAEMKRRIRKWTTRNAAFSVSAQRVAAPSDLKVLRSIRLDTGSPSLDKPLRLGTVEMVSERLARANGATGRPDTVALLVESSSAGYLLFAPEPDQTYTAELFYTSTLTPLSSSVASNSVLVEAPDAYLFGALMHAETYLEHDERIPVWKSRFDAAIEQLNAEREEYEHTASIRDIRLPRVFG